VTAVSTRLLQRRLLRSAAALLVPALMIPALAACGSAKTGYGDATVTGLDVATIGGDFGKTPTIEWSGQQAYPATTQTKKLVTGTGPAVGAASADLHIYLGDSVTDINKAESSCNQPSDSASSSPSTPPTPSTTPSSSVSAVPTPSELKSCPAVTWPLKGTWAYATADGSYESIAPTAGTIWQTLLSDAKVGDRLEVLVGSDQVFPGDASSAPGNPTIGVGTKDPLVMVIDVMRLTPKPADDKPHDVSPSALPKVLTNGKDVPQGLDWKGITKPDDTTPVQRAILKQGKGAVVGANDTVTVNYYGMTYQAKTPFDESYVDKTTGKPGKPFTSALSGLVQGWAIGLTGVKVGSRVLLQIPPTYGYGSAGSPPSIPGDATLWFVIDVISSKAGS
jgi:peptidylprolyl isomerase